MSEKYGKLPENTQSYWIDSVKLPTFPRLEEDINVDVVIVGGGIAGLTSAFLLVNEGLKVAIIEADHVLNGTTGNTTAKISAQHGLIYDEFIRNIGESKAKLYYEANAEAMHFIENTISEHRIDCDFSKQDAYVYAVTEEYAMKVKKEAKAYEKLGINGELVNSIPFNIDIQNGIVMKDQAQFHPLKYLAHLLQHITEKGGQIFENTTAVNIETKEQPKVLTRENHSITAKHVLICTHFPFYEGMGLYSARMHASSSYVLATKVKSKYPGGMYISAEMPSRSLRSATINDEEYVLVLGEDHKTGQGGDILERYKALEDFTEHALGLESIAYRWTAQDLITLDKLPYIGNLTSNDPNILIATGFRKWGMTNGTAAALLFRDVIVNKGSKYQDLYSPSRFYANPSLKNLLAQNVNVAGQFMKGKFGITTKSLEDIKKDEGGVITINGQRKGAYRDTEGELHIVDTTCTHLGCEVEWNNGQRSWDCPCHGSRFTYTGEVIEGPAEKPLSRDDHTFFDNFTSKNSGY